MKIIVEKREISSNCTEYSIYDESYNYKGFKRLKYVITQKDPNWPMTKIVLELCSCLSDFKSCFEIIPELAADYDYDKEVNYLYELLRIHKNDSKFLEHPKKTIKENTVILPIKQFVFCTKNISEIEYILNTFNSFNSLSIFFLKEFSWDKLKKALEDIFLSDIDYNEKLNYLLGKAEIHAHFDEDGEVLYLRFLKEHRSIVDRFINKISD